MTTTIGKAATAKTLERMSGTQGVHAQLAALARTDAGFEGSLEGIQIRAQNVSAELAEKAGAVKYPAMNIYCQKVVNDFREKFRAFSGRVWMGLDVRHSQDRLEGLETKLQFYVDSALQALGQARGDWGDGMYYAGGYEVSFGPVKAGGRHFIQSATVTFAIEVGR